MNIGRFLIKKGKNLLLNILLSISILILLWLVILIFMFSSYYIPSDSMQPILFSGDYILVNKLAYGARLFNLKKALEGKPVVIHRVYGYTQVKRNDIVVFNNPYPNTQERIEFDIFKYYVKRCIALPGDSIEIQNAHYKVRGVMNILGNQQYQDSLMKIFRLGGKMIDRISIRAFPKHYKQKWTISNFGPLYLPKKGDILVMNKKHYYLYRRLIEWETGGKLAKYNSCIFLNDTLIKEYRFEHDYYFMGGDNVFSSVDSRYWGLLPDDFIAGKVCGIWKSEDLYTRKIRWNRIGFID